VKDEEIEIIGPENLQKYRSIEQQILVDRDPLKQWCPKPGCGKFV